MPFPRFALTIILLSSISVSATEMVVIAHASQPLELLSKEQAALLFLGKAKRLPNGESVQINDLPKSDYIKSAFYQELTGRNPAQMSNYRARQLFSGRSEIPKPTANQIQMKSIIAGTPGNIGYIEASKVDDTVKVLLRLTVKDEGTN